MRRYLKSLPPAASALCVVVCLALTTAAFIRGQVPAPAIVYLPGSGIIDAAAYGVTPGPDCTQAFQALVAAMPKGSTIGLTLGTYNVSATIDFRTGIKNAQHVDHIWIKGAGAYPGQGTTIRGNFAGPVMAYNAVGLDNATSARIEGIAFVNDHPLGVGLQLERIDGAEIRNCVFGPAHRGLVIGEKQFTNVDVGIHDCTFWGNVTSHPDGIGAAIRAQGLVTNAGVYRWGAVGMRLSNNVGVQRFHAENNRVAFQLGVAPDGTNGSTSGKFSNFTLEANNIPIQVTKGATNCVFDSIGIHGTGGVIAPKPQLGIDVQAGSGPMSFCGLQVNGSFTTAAIRLNGSGPVVGINVNASVKDAPGLPWSVTTPADKQSWLQSNKP